jgi:hypothetical protein
MIRLADLDAILKTTNPIMGLAPIKRISPPSAGKSRSKRLQTSLTSFPFVRV